MKSPLLLLAACFALGILIAHALRPGFPDIPILIAFAACCLLCGLVFLRRDRTRISGCLALVGFVLAGMAATVSFQNRFLPNDVHNLADWGLNLKKDVRTEGVIVTNPIRGHDSFRFDLECRRIERAGQWRKVRGKVQVRLFTPANAQSWAAADALNLRYGDLIRAPVRFEKPMVYRNPGSFDFRGWLEAVKDISWEGDIESPIAVKKVSESQASRFSMLVANVRKRLLRSIDRLYPSWSSKGRVGAVLKAVLLGDRSSLDSDTVENFRQSGLYHLLVISGLHVGLLAAVLLFFLRFLGVGESWRAVWLLLFLGSYALLVEQRAPTLRASLMIAAYLMARYLYRDRAALNAVGFAALVLLFYRPAWLFEAGFDLSFSAALLIAGLAIPVLQRTTVPYLRALAGLDNVERDSSLAPRMAQLRLDLRAVVSWFKSKVAFLDQHPAISEEVVTMPVRVFLWTFDLLLFSAILQVGLFMPMAETFHRITIVGIGLNAIALPLMTLIIALAVPTVILAATVPFLAALPAQLLFWATSALLAVTEFRGEPFWMSYRIPGPPVWVAVGFALALFAVAFSLRYRRRLLWGSVATFTLFAGLVIFYPFPPKIPKGMLQVTALDCGRGEAIFSVLPDGTTMLVDAGGREHFGPDVGRWNPGEEIVSPYLWSRGIRKIDVVVLGDGSDQNIDAMRAILDNFQVRELWRSPAVSNPDYITLIRTARERGVKIREVVAGDRDTRSGVGIQVLWPPFILPRVRLPLSDRSPVLRIVDGDGEILLRGNTDDRIERILAKSGARLDSTVLESDRPLSEIISRRDFLARVNPKIVLDTGKNSNSRQREDLLHLKNHGFPELSVFQTAEDGAVTINMKKSSLSVHCYGTAKVFNWRRPL
ncbi:MAG: ComEC/Rec2 family competence protein [Acidobacteriota bacterium]